MAYVGVYPGVAEAEADYQLVKDLHTEAGLIDAYDAAVIERRDDGKVKITRKHETPTRVGGVLGGGVGLATGLVIALFPFAGIGAGLLAATTAGGAVLGAVAGHAAAGMSRDDLKELGEQLDAGQAGLVVVGVSDMGAKIEQAMRRAEKVQAKQLKADTAAIEADAKSAGADSGAVAFPGAGAPPVGGDRVDDRLEDLAHVLDLGLAVELHAQASHHGQAAQVRRVGDGDDPGQPQGAEGVVQPAGRGLGGVAVAPVLVGQPPGHLDVVGEGFLVVQAAHAQEGAVLAPLDGQQPQPFAVMALLGPGGDLVGVLAAQRPSQVAGDLGVGVEGRVQRQVVAPEPP